MLPELHPDFQDLLNCLTRHDVEYIVVGAHALAVLGVARYTQDFDVWTRRTEENNARLQTALREFGLELSDENMRDFLRERKFLRFGHVPVRIEILNFLDGCDFDAAFPRSPEQVVAGTRARFLGLEDYVATKQASGRPKDAADLELLRSMIGPLPGDPDHDASS